LPSCTVNFCAAHTFAYFNCVVIDKSSLVKEGCAKAGIFAKLYKIQQENLGWSV
jgi:hypothetical protein